MLQALESQDFKGQILNINCSPLRFVQNRPRSYQNLKTQLNDRPLYGNLPLKKNTGKRQLNNPFARSSEIVVQETKDEVLIYDLKRNKAVCLNDTSARIWRMCDGKNTPSDIAKKMSNHFGETINEDFVLLGLNDLAEEGLLDESYVSDSNFAGPSRRGMIRKIGFASVIALPMISSLIAPKASMAQSGAPAGPLAGLGQGCTAFPCAPGLFCRDVFGFGTCCVPSTFFPPLRSPNNNLSGFSCVDQPTCDGLGAANCCSGAGTLQPAPGCTPGTGRCVCAPY